MLARMLSRWEVVHPDGSREVEESTGHEVTKWGGRLGLATVSLFALAFLGGSGPIGLLSSGGGLPIFVEDVGYDPPNTPVLDVAVLEGDTTVTLSTSAFVGSGNDTQASASWWIVSLANAGYDTVWSSLADADSLTLWTGAGITGGAGLAADSTHRAFALHTGTNGGPSAVDSVEFVATSATVAWFCDWRFGTGTGTSEIRGTDATTYSIVDECHTDHSGTTTATLEVIPKPTGETGCLTGWPSTLTNVLRSNVKIGTDNKMVIAGGVVDAPDVGEYLFYRIYQCAAYAVADSVNKHWFHYGSGTIPGTGSPCTDGASCYSGRMFNQWGKVRPDSTYPMDFGVMFNLNNKGRGQGEFAWDGFRAHRIEVIERRLHRFHTDSARVSIRVLDTAGNVLAESTNAICHASDTGGCQNVGGGGIDYIGQYAVLIQDWRRVTAVEVGHNGGGASMANDTYQYLCCSAISEPTTNANAWIGLYPVGPEAN